KRVSGMPWSSPRRVASGTTEPLFDLDRLQVVDHRLDACLHRLLSIDFVGTLEGIAPDRHVDPAVAFDRVPTVDRAIHLVAVELASVALGDERQIRRAEAERVRQGPVALRRLPV